MSKSWMLNPQRIKELQALLSSNNHISSLALLCPEVIPFSTGSFWENPHHLRLLGARDQIVQKAYAGAAMEKYAATYTGLSHKSWLSWEVMQTAPHCLGWEAERLNKRWGHYSSRLPRSQPGPPWVASTSKRKKGKKKKTQQKNHQQCPEGGQYCLGLQIIPYTVVESCCDGNQFHS